MPMGVSIVDEVMKKKKKSENYVLPTQIILVSDETHAII
jgi:hypothetical protein